MINITKAGFSASTCTATYKRVDTATTPTAFETALGKLDICEVSTGVIPTVVAAPKFSKDPTYHVKMITKANSKISGKWGFVCVSDIPTATNADVASAITWKNTNGYTSRLDKVCFPKVSLTGIAFHLSTLAVVTMQQIDTAAEGVPYISPSNKAIYADSAILDSAPIYIDEPTANSLNTVGITSVNIVKGSLHLWGNNMANYLSTDATILPENKQDASIRMMIYMQNFLQYNYMDEIDGPIARRDIDSIIASVQQWMNSLISDGMLLYALVNFVAESNSTGEMVDGNFVFDIATTTTPNAKSVTFKLQYSLAGLNSLMGGN